MEIAKSQPGLSGEVVGWEALQAMSCWWRRPLCLCMLPLSHLGPLRKTFGHKLAMFNYEKMPAPCHWGTRCCWVQYQGGHSRLMEGVLWVMQRHCLFVQHPSRLRSRNGWNLWAKKGSPGVWATLDAKCWKWWYSKRQLAAVELRESQDCLSDRASWGPYWKGGKITMEM